MATLQPEVEKAFYLYDSGQSLELYRDVDGNVQVGIQGAIEKFAQPRTRSEMAQSPEVMAIDPMMGASGRPDPAYLEARASLPMEKQREMFEREAFQAIGAPLGLSIATLMTLPDLISLPPLIAAGMITAEEGKKFENVLNMLKYVPSAQVGEFLKEQGKNLGFSDAQVEAFGEGYLGGELSSIVVNAVPGAKQLVKGAKWLKDSAVDYAAGAPARVPSKQPIIIENPDAGPLDRSKLPSKPAKPETVPAEIDELGFVMKSLEVAKNLQQQRGTAAQFIKRLKQNGVSDEEIDALNLRDKFKSNERITRAQLEQTIRDRRIELEESVKRSDVIDNGDDYDFGDLTFGQGTPDRDSMNWQGRAEDFMMEAKDGEEYAIDIVLDQLKQNYPDDYSPEQIASIKQSLLNKEFDQLDARDRSNIDDAAYDAAEAEYMENPFMEYRANETDNYTIYGNDDIGYQVLRYGTERVNDQEIYSLPEAQVVARQDAYEQGDLAGADSATEARFENYMMPGGENYQEILLRDPGTPTGGSRSHWNETDVIGHVLTKDRIDSKGRKALYAEEIQSDFAQSARPSSSEKTRIEVANRSLEMAKRNLDFATEQAAQIKEQIKKLDETPIEQGQEPARKDSRRKLETELESMEFRAKDANQEIKTYGERVAELEAAPKARAAKVEKTRFVKNTQQWLRPTMKRLIAKAIEDGYDVVAVPPHEIVHNRWNEDYGDFYRKSVPNTLLKVAKQLDPNAKLSRADFIGNLIDDGYEGTQTLKDMTKFGLGQVQVIEITPAMKKAYQEKGQSLFVGAPTAIIGGKIAYDASTKDRNND